MLQTADHIAAPAQRLNLAIGLFDQLGRLEATINELRKRNLKLAHCRFVVPRHSRVFPIDALARLPADITVERITLNGLSIERAWSDVIVSSAMKAGVWTQKQEQVQACHMPATVLARQNRRLMQHLEPGGGVLIVGGCDAVQQQKVAELLLPVASGVFTDQLRTPSCAVNQRVRYHKSDQSAPSTTRII
ncbi:MAG TPA: hypothetical protein P5114_01995 [Hyphomicrobiaceae bacterium]|nr:hypothetical protein [Hyphomicrobiaceae bacterium]